MYSAIPALVSFLFLFFGLFVVNHKGINRVSTSFLVLCITTFFWQFTWAALFQTTEANTANQLIKIGWLLILVLPTALYHFSCEITGVRSDLKFVSLSYCFSIVLIAVMIATDRVIDGYYIYFWGFYPKAGDMLWLHVVQTVMVVSRSVYNTYKRLIATKGEERARLSYCLFGILVYSFAAVDYLCNYGFEFYPPGVLFITVALGIIAVALVRFKLVDSVRSIAASLAHEMRTPMATVKLHAQVLSHYLPTLIDAYEKSVDHGLTRRTMDTKTLGAISDIAQQIEKEMIRSNQAIDMLLALTTDLDRGKRDYTLFSAEQCIKDSLSKFYIESEAPDTVRLSIQEDFQIHGSEMLFSFVILNLLKNAVYAVKEKGKGEIFVTVRDGTIQVQDTGIGIPSSVLPHIFEDFYTTKPTRSHAGVGLTFCKRVVESFDGKISCRSEYAIGSTFTITFPHSHDQPENQKTEHPILVKNR